MFHDEQKKQGLGLLTFNLILSLFIAGVYNFAFFGEIWEISHQEGMSGAFGILAPLSLLALFVLVWMLLFSWRYLCKPVFILFALMSGPMLYGAQQFGVVYDKDMLDNFLQTHTGEAFSYLTLKAVLYTVFLGMVPAFVAYKIRIKPAPWGKTLVRRLMLCGVLLVFIAGSVLSCYQQFSFVGREHKTVIKKIIPYTAIFDMGRLIDERYLTEPLPYEKVGEDAVVDSSTTKKITLLVVGETARAKNFSSLGYERLTNPFTQELGLFNFKRAFSCDTATAKSVPCMFSNLTRAGFTPAAADSRDNVLDVLKRAGVNVLWVENDSGCKGVCRNVKTINIQPRAATQVVDVSLQAPTVAAAPDAVVVEAAAAGPTAVSDTSPTAGENQDRNVDAAQNKLPVVATKADGDQESLLELDLAAQCADGSCNDAVLLPVLKKAMDAALKSSNDTVLVFHVIGSHGPKYQDRYPRDFAEFKPDMFGKNVDSASLEEVVNSYDNSIRYTDYILASFIKIMQQAKQAAASDAALSVMYISDHGESLGENGLFLHGTPYMVAPNEQIHIPWQVYLESAASAAPAATAAAVEEGEDADSAAEGTAVQAAAEVSTTGIDMKCLQNQLDREISHDFLFHSLLGLMQVKTAAYNKELDIYAPCRAGLVVNPVMGSNAQ